MFDVDDESVEAADCMLAAVDWEFGESIEPKTPAEMTSVSGKMYLTKTEWFSGS